MSRDGLSWVDAFLRALVDARAQAVTATDEPSRSAYNPPRPNPLELSAELAAYRAQQEAMRPRGYTITQQGKIPMQNNVGVDLFSGLQHFSAHNIPALSHRIVVATGDGTTVFFQTMEDASRYAQRIIRRGMEDEVAIFELTPAKLIKAKSPLVEIEELGAGQSKVLQGTAQPTAQAEATD
jgi:hypothetical protein